MAKAPAPVSAVIAAYNAEAFIAEAIESVRAQTLPVAEILVVDDGSTDSTPEIARTKGARVIRQSNAGLAVTRNRCVREASQPWIAFIDSDDIWAPEKIEKQMRIAECDPEIALVACDYSTFDGSVIFSPSVLEDYAEGYRSQPKTRCEGGAIIETLDESFTGVAYFLVPSLIIARKDVLEQTPFDEDLFVAEDFDCFMRVWVRHKVGIADEVLAKRREHSDNHSRSFTEASLSCVAATHKVLEHPEFYPPAAVSLCKAWLPANLRHAGSRLVWSGQSKRGRDLLRESARLELSVRTILALGAAAFPPRLGSEFMKARYYISRRFGI
jgi:glycosyltransferase involved in cell wall biosynthesis